MFSLLLSEKRPFSAACLAPAVCRFRHFTLIQPFFRSLFTPEGILLPLYHQEKCSGSVSYFSA
jgi:hypothetical protein